jgi:hypothetical protein
MKFFSNICFLFVFLSHFAQADVRSASKNKVVTGKVVQVLTILPEGLGYKSGIFLDVQNEQTGQVYAFTYEDSYGCYQEFVNKYLASCKRVAGNPKWSRLFGHRVRVKQIVTYWTSRKMLEIEVLD